MCAGKAISMSLNITTAMLQMLKNIGYIVSSNCQLHWVSEVAFRHDWRIYLSLIDSFIVQHYFIFLKNNVLFLFWNDICSCHASTVAYPGEDYN